jgi:HEPN domain-containing protein
MKETTAAWIAKAESDFAAARLVLEHGEEHIADAVCFHGQQCAEKYLKGFLHEQEIEFPREHALIPLLELCVAFDDSFSPLKPALNGLNTYAVTIRYPGVIATRSMAERAVADATRVRAFVRGKLGLPD